MTEFPNLERDPHMKVTPETCYVIECRRKGRVIWREEFHNLVTTVGKNKLIDACFKTGEGANQWFVGLVNNAGFTGYSAADTMAAHGGWAEDTDYTEANRQAFACGVPAGGSADNSASRAVFTMNATVTIRGAFLVDDNTKGGAGGTLYGVGDFSVARGVIAGDQIYAQATIQVT